MIAKEQLERQFVVLASLDQIFFVTTKLPGKYHHFEDALKMIEESLLRTGLSYFDLYLIHWPLPKRDNYVEAWKALIAAKKKGVL